MIDYIIVGAGFAGTVLAERLASQNNKKILIIEKRKHIAGNCYDHYDEQGVLVHKYGPHLFHTDNAEVFKYLGGFTSWLNYQHEVLALVDGQKIPIPFNLNSLKQLFSPSLASSLEKKLIERYGFDVKVPILELRKEEDKELKYLADYIYRKIFANYTAKQWGCTPEEIDPEVTARVPVFISRDNRYFQDKYQAVPKHGYTRLFTNLLDHDNIKLLLNTDYKDVLSFDSKTGEITIFGQPFSGQLIYTGMIDELFDWRFGELPYRSLQFDFEYFNQASYQQATTENYPDNYDFTRITEFKHLTRQEISGTTIVREFPQDYDRKDTHKNTPYYPMLKDENRQRYEQYYELSQKFDHLTLVGRLAEYRYYDMDDIVARALEVYKEHFAT
ncbi:MAG: UDP-galactopyranose mutase [Candidatus Thiodiazotropha sp. (ex Lucinoma borealis)]|nr:UDP-galactopyranose mutase [Candidatus Thiodiazotropha sp. (ex Lucinoma borealis)]